MKENWWTKLTDRVIEEELDSVDAYIEEFIDPIADIGSPAQVLGKPYDEWTTEDLAALSRIYDPNALNKYIASKEISKLYELEKEVK